MGRYARHPYTSSLRDSPWSPEGDSGWVGIDMLHAEQDAGAIRPGMLAAHVNKRLRNRASVKRKGTVQPPDFNPIFAGRIAGSGVFSNPNGAEVMLVAIQGKRYVWALQSGKDPIQINYAEDAPGANDGFIEFVQYFDKVALKREPSGVDLIWDGFFDNTQQAHTFTPVVLSQYGLRLIPKTTFGEPYMDRVLLYNYNWDARPWRDQIVMTDPVDYSSYDEVYGVFRINSGESDTITRVMAYYKGNVMIFKRHSIHMLSNFTGIDFRMASQRVLSTTRGSIGNKFPLQSGREIYFLAEQEGIFKVNEVIEEQIVVEPLPVSLPIQPLIDQINWSVAIRSACSAKLGEYAFFGVPINGTHGCDAILVLNTATGQWESAPDIWTDRNFQFNRLLVTNYEERKRIFALDYANSKIYVLYEGVTDEIDGQLSPIQDLLFTRGYMLGDESAQKRYHRAVIAVSTLDPNAGVFALTDGMNEQKRIGTIIKDPTEWYIHGRPPFEPGGSNERDPYREDYLVPEAKLIAIDFENMSEGQLAWIPATPVQSIGEKQRSLERFTIKMNGRYCQIAVTDSGTNCDVLSVQVEGVPTQETFMKVA